MALREDIEKQGNWLFRWRSYLPLLVIPIFIVALRHARVLEYIFGDRAADCWETLSIFISFLGLGIRCLTVGYVPRGTSGRNTKSQLAESLNTTGMYSITRNPIYLGNFIIVFGITLFIQVWWFALVVWVGFWLYYERIIFSEEEFLRKKFGVLFIEWANKTPVLIPNFSNWKKPDLPFSSKTVIRREFSTFFSIVAVFFFLEVSTNFLLYGKFEVHRSWIYFFIVGLIIYLTCFILKKKTKLLNVPGR
ncbi:MAG: isoprenylcysteine carboxylmethyltransferase family protein [Candidatus Omnitrophota bacterium]